MIRVLQDWREVGAAVLALQHAGLPTHPTPQKNWDHIRLREALRDLDPQTPIADLGCGEGHALRLLHALGFSNLTGIDLRLSWRARAGQWARMLRGRTLRAPFRLQRGDLTRTPFADGSFGFVAAVSVIEHGVDLEAFLREASRLLGAGGLLFVTTDYWPEPLALDRAGPAFGLPWRPFSHAGIASLAQQAQRHQLLLVANTPIPASAERTVTWQGVDFTFLSLLLRKDAAAAASAS